MSQSECGQDCLPHPEPTVHILKEANHIVTVRMWTRLSSAPRANRPNFERGKTGCHSQNVDETVFRTPEPTVHILREANHNVTVRMWTRLSSVPRANRPNFERGKSGCHSQNVDETVYRTQSQPSTF
jgi:hypothetical protein